MSLILDALRKLDREKGVPSRGFVVLAPGQRTAATGSRAALVAVLVLGAMVAFVAVSFLPVQKPAPALSPAPARALVLPIPKPSLFPALVPAVSLPAPPPKAPPPGDGSARTFVLEAISERDGSPVAVVNDHLVKEGDVVDGARIVRIGTDEVEIEVGGAHRVVRF
jgi:hypothetical protein